MRSLTTLIGMIGLLVLAGSVDAQCDNSNGQRIAGAPANTTSAPSTTSSGQRATVSSRPSRRRTASSASGIPQITNPYSAMTNPLAAFQSQQVMAQRMVAEAAVRNRRSPARQQQMLKVNAERAYQAGLSAERSGRIYTALQRYERAAGIAPGSLAAQYAEEAISRLSAR